MREGAVWGMREEEEKENYFLSNFIVVGTVFRWVLQSVFGCVRVFFFFHVLGGFLWCEAWGLGLALLFL